jgi:hypothetical protein
VSLVSQYTRRDRPGDLLRVRLARLLNAATREEAASLERLPVVLPGLHPVVPHIRGQGDELLLLDSEIKTTLEDWSNVLDDTERDEFEPPNGLRWKRLQGYLDSYRELLDQLEDIGGDLARIRIRPEGQWTLFEADILKPILALLQPPSGIANADDLRSRKREASAQAPRLKTILEIQDMLLAVWQDDRSLRAKAETQLERLWGATGAGDLATEKTRAKELYEGPRTVRAGKRAPEVEETRKEIPPSRMARRRSPTGLIAGLAAVLLLVAVVILTRPLNASPTPGLGFEFGEPSAKAVNLVGLVLLAAVAIPVVLVTRRLVRRRDRGRLHGEDEVSLRQALRRRDAAYAVLSGLLVILSGMSLVYAADATFGTAGDYLTILLWGTAVSEGLALAKSLLPSFS